MNLDLFNNLIKSTKENNVVQSFLKELGEFLENNLYDNKRNEVPLVEKILDGRNLTTRYRDKINIEKHNIINNYSKENSSQGKFYYVYSKESDDTYGIVMHENGVSGKEVWVEKNKIPKGVEVDAVLREEKGRFVLDKEATEELQKELTEMINKLLEEQSNRLESQRVEGHIYEFVEKVGNTIELCDITNYTGECFEEIDFPSDLLDKATQGTKFKYVNGEYQLID